MDIGYLGPEGSYSHIAAHTMFPKAHLVAFASFPLVMQSLVSGQTQGIVIPIENTLNGGVLQNFDLLQETEGVVAVRSLTVKVEHRLATRKGAPLDGIKRIYSHSQALEQCAKYLYEHFPDAKLIPVLSTSASLDKIVTDEEAGIVGAHIEREGVVLSKQNIAENDNNYTHFLYVERGSLSKDKHTKKIYFCATCENKSGGLLSFLQKVAQHGLNMNKIESRPVKSTPSEFRFFIEIDGDYADGNVRTALQDIENSALSFKLLGAY